MPKQKNKKIEYQLPEVGVKRKTIIWVFIICVILGASGVVSFFIWKEINHKADAEIKIDQKTPPPDFKYFSNDYWGFKFYYPGTWFRVRGDVKDSEFYFASEPIEFLNELSSSEALFGVRTFNNFDHSDLQGWFDTQERLYLPFGKIVKKEDTKLLGLPARHYIMVPAKPIGTISYYEIYTVSVTDMSKLQLILMTSSEEKNQDFQKTYQQILSSFTFYKGFGEEK